MFRWRYGLGVLPAVALLFLLGADAAVPRNEKVKPIRALLVTGGPHHDYEKQKDILSKGISARAPVEWTIAYDPIHDVGEGKKHLNPVFEKADWATGFDVVVHDECCSEVKDEAIIARILEPHRQGLPAVVLHCGMHSYRSAGWPKMTPWFEFTGLPSTGHGPQRPIAITFTDKDHPITKGLSDWTTGNEELYNNSAGKVLNTAHPLARGKQNVRNRDGKERIDDYVVAWTNLYKGKTRVFATTLGHHNATVADGRYLDLVTRGLLWAVDKLDDAHLKAAEK
jgi:type 1 glutamine amidotransferase